LASVIPFRDNVYTADIVAESLKIGKKRYGFTNSVIIDESGKLPFADKSFDLVFCSSVIEHLTGDKKNVQFLSSAQFIEAAQTRQRRFASEIRRIGKCYFVQTPHKYFPIESHTWLPVFIVFLPRGIQVRMIDLLNEWWPKKTTPDWSLLTKVSMRELFPDAKIVSEEVFGFTKSLMAIKS